MASNSLQYLKSGDIGVIECVTAADGAAKRLADLGFIRGSHLEMVRPGSPCIVRLAGSCVGLGIAHQAAIQLGVL